MHTSAETQKHVFTSMKAEIAMDVDHSRQLVTTVWRGDFDLEAIAGNCERRIAQGGHRYPQIIDATEAGVVRKPQDTNSLAIAVLDLAARSQKNGTAGRTAVVVGSKVDFGMCRAIAAYFEPAGEIAVFYTRADAERWLWAAR